MTHSRIAIIVAGPTCSGKSALALNLATRFGGHVLNADSMQVYRDLRVLTARPSEHDENAAPHRLYGVLDAEKAGSVAWWRSAALDAMATAWRAGAVPILCGGTGMYLRALTDGLVEVPDPGASAREEARTMIEVEGAASVHARLAAVDPETASGLRATDGQRIARAWEVWRGTGHGLAWWRKQPGLPPAPCRFLAVRLDPPRPLLREAIAKRFRTMLDEGALAEVDALMARDLSSALPAMRAHGVPELIAYRHGTIGLDEALERAVLATGRYTRRQATWFNHHSLATDEDTYISRDRFDPSAQLSKRESDKIEIFIHERLTCV
ncbi:tRNA isopentenyltransferase [Neoasaia chiangmaiensis NBRC 101099]|uniref:tRNA dimethylallyltransferase n=1 Tax=Neoasaia chiangmaiensis TaxID=320497 RepID=A0A1U9KSG2_9PROT|nr:tRNA (adenosine(37)-N6)-dimethylallyltransferase MiaA [Neoasaia chiangmaiensis]AQS88748.1 tRNA dimethylallyltransferase [Neoasaia chiangmaiensis]GBR40864.1 tRNA isopentenyltransferase [Neoasaia chiangmaiensis NBRC 101099]GEN13708.1 tRNA dimethylallyltransferase [Neoasaia chiangmaiensis]